jgi:glycosyltransferase involved in cell wall biosynthesis
MPPFHTPAEADKSWVEDGVEIRNVSLNAGMLGITRTLIREVLAWQPDVVHCFKPKAYSGLVAWWLWQFHRHKIRLIMDTDDWEGAGGWNDLAPYSPLQKRFFAWQEIWGMRHCHALTVASKTLQSLAWGHGVKQVVYVPNGAGVAETGGQEDKRTRGQDQQPATSHQLPTILLYSRLFEFDVGRLVDILKRVRGEMPVAERPFRVLSIGSGLYSEDANHFREQLAQADLLGLFDDRGWVAEAELPALLQSADVGIYLMEDTLLNRTKCPVKLADMVANGVPVVGERVGQVEEYVLHGETGYLRESGENAGIAKDIVTLLQSRDLRQTFAKKAREHYQQDFAWEKQAGQLEKIYQRVWG